MERQPFEKAWHDAFQGKEKQPAPQIWSAISNELANTAAARNRRRMVFFQWLAAASVVFALTVVFLNERPFLDQQPVTRSEQVLPAVPQDPAAQQTPTSTPSDAALSAKAQGSSTTNSYTRAINASPAATKTASKQTQSTAFLRKADFQQRALAFLAESRSENNVVLPLETQSPNAMVDSTKATPERTTSPTQVTDPTPEAATLANQATLAHVANEQPVEPKKQASRALWTSVGFAGGGFTTAAAGGTGGGLEASTTADFAMTNGMRSSATATSQKAQVGTAFSFGIGVGKMIAGRWSLQTGLVYLQQSVGYTSNLISLGTNTTSAKVYLAETLSATNYSADLAITTPYQLQAQVNYLAVPMMAGYVVLDRTFSIQVNGGVATDFLVQSAWQDRSGLYTTNRQSANDVYRPVNWAGLFNTEFSYRVGKHYRASLVPGVRYSMQPIYRPEIRNDLRPLIWDIGFRIRYQF